MNQKYCLSFGALIVITLITMKSGLDFTDKLGSGDANSIDTDFYENGESIVIENNAKTKTLRRRVKGKRLPDIIILGIMKCGTGTLLEMLRLHPNIVAPGYYKTENTFYAEDQLYEKGEQYFIDKMPEAEPHELIITKSPGLIDEDNLGLERLKQSIPDVKLLLVVKNPLSRFVSQILHHYVNIGGELKDREMPDNLDDLILDYQNEFGNLDRVEKSVFNNSLVYSEYVDIYNRVLNYFDKNQIFVVDGDNLVGQPLEEIRRVEQFLDIPKFYSEKNFVFPNSGSRFPCFVTEKDEMFCMGKEKGREHPLLKEETVLLLKNYFKPMIDEFYTLTGTRLNIDQ